MTWRNADCDSTSAGQNRHSDLKTEQRLSHMLNHVAASSRDADLAICQEVLKGLVTARNNQWPLTGIKCVVA